MKILKISEYKIVFQLHIFLKEIRVQVSYDLRNKLRTPHTCYSYGNRSITSHIVTCCYFLSSVYGEFVTCFYKIRGVIMLTKLHYFCIGNGSQKWRISCSTPNPDFREYFFSIFELLCSPSNKFHDFNFSFNKVESQTS